MTPFYHPTSILVLDDDPLFLESLDFQFSEEVSCQTFTRPDAALEHLRAQANSIQISRATSETSRSQIK